MEQRPESPELINFDDYFYEEEIECERHQDIQPFDHHYASPAAKLDSDKFGDEAARPNLLD